MAATHEYMFYELMWRAWSSKAPYPVPWWTQQYFRQWTDSFDSGLFNSKEAAFSSNASYRYWNMIGVKDHHCESLIGQAGEIEPVYDQYALAFFLFDKQSRQLYFPQFSGAPRLKQKMEDGYLPIVITEFNPRDDIQITAKASATVVGPDNKSVVLADYIVSYTGSNLPPTNLCLYLTAIPYGPSGFQRHDYAGRYQEDGRVQHMQFDQNHKLLNINGRRGPVFNQAPNYFGLYGNGSSNNPDHYLAHNPFQDLSTSGTLNSFDEARDYIAGLCCGAFGWDIIFDSNRSFLLEAKLPVDDFRGNELNQLSTYANSALFQNNRTFWIQKLNQSGAQLELPEKVAHLKDLYRLCRANLLILADDGQIHPGPTIYDEFWIRDSAIEGIAVSLAGDLDLAKEQFGTHYPRKFNTNYDYNGSVSLYGFFGGKHEKDDREWDANGQALWAFGRYDRINKLANFGAAIYYPHTLFAVRWLRDNRSSFGLLHSGWSAEHLGGKDQPHYWDNFWAIAGTYEAAKLAERLNTNEKSEIWSIYHSLVEATSNSIRWVLQQQKRNGEWETFIPTGPANVGLKDSTMIGALAYFHPCRLYMGNKLGSDIDYAARMTLETIWSHFIDNGGFRHDSAWNCYGPYLTLQLAHSFLLIGDKERMDHCLRWIVANAGYATVSRAGSDEYWQVVQGAWNEQHCYPISKNFNEFPNRPWYMGDIPHGWAAAELITLVRDIMFFEADEDSNPHIYIAPGLMPHWIKNGDFFGISQAETIFGEKFSFRLKFDAQAKCFDISLSDVPSAVRFFIFPCPLGKRIRSITIDGNFVNGQSDLNVRIASYAREISVAFED